MDEGALLVGEELGRVWVIWDKPVGSERNDNGGNSFLWSWFESVLSVQCTGI